MTNRPYVLAESTWKSVAFTSYEVAVLPWGATEAHNYHLPYGTDTIQSDHIATEAARLAWERGARVVVLPTVPFGVQTGQMDVPLCLNMNPSTQAAMLRDVARSIDRAAIPKLVILNGHGGNDFRSIVRELQPDVRTFLCVVDWYRVLKAGKYFDDPGDHAGEMETSLMQHLAPALVRPLSEAGPGTERKFRIGALREGWAWAPRQWSRITADTGVGDPTAASAAKGARFVQDLIDRIAHFLVELAGTASSEMYEAP